MAGDNHEHVIDTGKGKFSLDSLGPLLPGMAELMPLVGERIWKCWYAGQARNRRLASFQLKEAVSLMKKAAVLRPKYHDNIKTFIANEVTAVRTAIEAEDWDRFEPAFTAMVDEANRYHDVYGKPFLHWRVPEFAPPDLDMTAGMDR